MTADERSHAGQADSSPTTFSIKGLMLVTGFFGVFFFVLSQLTRSLTPERQVAVLAASCFWALLTGLYVLVSLMWRNRIAGQLGHRLAAINEDFVATRCARWDELQKLVVRLTVANGFTLPIIAKADDLDMREAILIGLILLFFGVSGAVMAGYSLMQLVIQPPELEFYDRAILTVPGYGRLEPLTGILWQRLTLVHTVKSDGVFGYLLLRIQDSNELVRLKIPDAQFAGIKELVEHKTNVRGWASML